MQATTLIATSLLLKDHEALALFGDLIAASPLSDGDASRFVVVCERKEDLVAVRAVLSRRVSDLRQGGPGLLAGVTMYTLDSFAETIMKSLALTPAQEEGGLLDPALKAAFRKPFLDVVTQEKLLRILLLRLRFPASDALSTAKQILTLLDVSFPEGENLFGLLLETQRIEKGTRDKAQQLTETAFKQILCAYQGAKTLLPEFSRLQHLVLEYLQADFRSHVLALSPGAASPSLSFPPKFLRSHLLWIAAPEYGDRTCKPEGYRPGNFQASLVDALRDAVFFAREHLSPEGFSTLHSRCYLSTAEASGGTPLSHVEARILSPRRHLWREATARLGTQEASGDLTLLADFPLEEERIFATDASGPQPLHEEVLERFARTTLEGPLPEGWSAIATTLEGLWNELGEAVSLLDLFSGHLRETARAYGLSYVGAQDQEFVELWKSHCLGEAARVGEPHPLSRLPRALSFFPNVTHPERIVALGRPHAPRSPSFIVKILNDAMAALRAKGVDVELPATDESYRGFYTWLAGLGVPLQFWISEPSEFEGFPEHLSHKKGVRVTTDAVSPAWSGDGILARLPPLSDVSWTARRNQGDEAPQISPGIDAGPKTLSMTQFERYVDCPMKFYLVDVLAIEEQEEDFTAAPPRETGTATHRMAEQFVSLYKLVGDAEESVPRKNLLRGRYLLDVKELLGCPRFLVDAPADLWKQELARVTLAHAGEGLAPVAVALVGEIVDVIFDPGYKGPSLLRRLLAEETVKRAFLRLVMTDLARLQEDPELQPAGFPEFRVDLSIGGLALQGRVDRVDFSPRGYHIIDYKTSKVRRAEGRLVLFPADATSDRIRLSVQGALYTLAWCRSHDEHPVAGFTLYRLKNLDAGTDVFLSADLEGRVVTKEGPVYARLEETYSALAASLARGDFPARPRNVLVCTHCPAIHACPRPRERAEQKTGGAR